MAEFNVYRKPLDEVPIPKGWRQIDYRVPLSGESYVVTSTGLRAVWTQKPGINHPKYIIIVEEGGEDATA